MRPYRGKTKEGKWVYGWYAEEPEDGAVILVNSEEPVHDCKHCLIEVSVIPETVGQSIDVKDINKKEMYFDDIIVWNKRKYIIVWNKTCLGVYLEHLESYLARQKDHKKGKFIESLLYGRAVYCEVIGNKTDNPELLETE